MCGDHNPFVIYFLRFGITPACAGPLPVSVAFCIFDHRMCRDHGHYDTPTFNGITPMCRDHDFSSLLGEPMMGSPPHVRGPPVSCNL